MGADSLKGHSGSTGERRFGRRAEATVRQNVIAANDFRKARIGTQSRSSSISGNIKIKRVTGTCRFIRVLRPWQASYLATRVVAKSFIEVPDFRHAAGNGRAFVPPTHLNPNVE